MEIKHKVAIVTGASGGIGLATARLLTEKGARVALAARNEGRLIEISAELPGSLPVKTDMTNMEDIDILVKNVFNHFGKIDILINNAGAGYISPVENITENNLRYIFDLNLLGPIIAMQKVIPIMRSQGSGSIINISSGTALMAIPNLGGYSSLKRALVGISLTAREELKKDKINVSLVYPGLTDTDFGKNALKEEVTERRNYPTGDSPEAVAEKILEAIEKEEGEVFVDSIRH